MSTTTDTEEIERALEDCDGVETTDLAVLDDGAFKLTVWFAEDTDTAAPLTDVLAGHDLRLWDVNFEWRTVTLVPVKALAYPELRPVSDGSEARESETLADRIERTELSEDPLDR